MIKQFSDGTTVTIEGNTITINTKFQTLSREVVEFLEEYAENVSTK